MTPRVFQYHLDAITTWITNACSQYFLFSVGFLCPSCNGFSTCYQMVSKSANTAILWLGPWGAIHCLHIQSHFKAKTLCDLAPFSSLNLSSTISPHQQNLCSKVLFHTLYVFVGAVPFHATQIQISSTTWITVSLLANWQLIRLSPSWRLPGP